MNRKGYFLVGGALVALGILLLLFTVIMSLIGVSLLGFALRFWPLIVVAAGLAFVLPPFRAKGNRGLGGLFIPGVPVLVTGGILFLASVLNVWSIWAWLWPMELLAVAIGFLAAALYMRVNGLLIPAIIVGINGLVFQFCAITGLWEWWSVLWTIEPLSVGLALLVFGAVQHVPGCIKAGFILCAIAAAGFLLMITILGDWWPVRLFVPGLIILAGLALLAWGLVRRHPSVKAVME
jgi:hypothetical protein